MPYRRTGRPTGRPPYPCPLTPAEERVLDLLREDLTDAEIAERLGLSRDTVHTHVNHMLAKLDLHDRRDLAAWRPEPEVARKRALVPAFLHRLAASKPAAALAGAALVTVIVAVPVALVVVSRGPNADEPSPTPAVVLTTPPAAPSPTPTVAPGTPVPTPAPATGPPPPNVVATVVASVPAVPVEPRLDVAGPMSFISPDEGWFLHRGEVMYTTDGGRHWRQVGSLPGDIQSWPFDFVTSTHGWAGRGPFLFRTTDGGVTWTDVETNVEGRIDAVDFIDEANGWSIRGRRVFRSSDGGETWKRLPNPCDHVALVSPVSVSSAVVACVTAPIRPNAVGTGIFSEIWNTTDGGETWSMVGTESDEPPPGAAHIAYHGYLDAISFTDLSRGLFATGGALYSTVDGGRTWALERDADPEQTLSGGREFEDGSLVAYDYTMGPGVLLRETDAGWRRQYPVSALSHVTSAARDTLFALDYSYDAPKFLRSDDGGANWTPAGLVPAEVVRELKFADVNNGWLITLERPHRDPFQLWRTTDAGASWTRGATFPTAAVPPDLSFIDAKTGYAYVARGTLQMTTDGGLTFTHVADTTRDDHVMATLSEGWRVRHVRRGGDILDATADGGQTWTGVATFNEIRRMLLLPGGIGWLETNESEALYRTDDNGRTWTRITLPLHAYGPFTAAEPDRVWMTDDAQRLLRSDDAGATWQVVRMP